MGGCTGDGRADDAEVTDDILLTMLAALSDDQRRRLVKLIANSPA